MPHSVRKKEGYCDQKFCMYSSEDIMRGEKIVMRNISNHGTMPSVARRRTKGSYESLSLLIKITC